MSTAVAEAPRDIPAVSSDVRSKRLLSIDALRGFDMVLVSAASFLVAMKGLTGMAGVDWLADQMTHPEWNGFTFYDLLFPLFLFLAGVSLSFSLGKRTAMGSGHGELYRKAFIRFLMLYCLGVLYSNLPVPFLEPSKIRFVNVLGRIGFAALLSTILYLNFSRQARLIWVSAILLGYYAALFLIPVPGYGAGDLSIEGNLVGWIDRSVLPGRLLQGNYDELGLLTQLPALCLTVLGTLAGDVLRSEATEHRKLGVLTIAGVVAMALGLLWSLHFPINKHLWSSSFIFLTGGMAFLFVALFYAVIDVWNYRKWAFLFQVIGLNSLMVYLAYRLVDFYHTSRMLFSSLYAPLPAEWRTVFDEIGAVALVWIFPYILYKVHIHWPTSTKKSRT
jgi:predicted acyltransferase